MLNKPYVIIPAGKPPTPLRSGSDEDILEWCRACQVPHEGMLTNTGLKYWVRYFCDVFDPEYKRIGEQIDVLVKDIAPASFASSYPRGGGDPPSEG